MSILNYEILNPKMDRKRPFLDKNGLFYFYTEYNKVKYYLECARINENTKQKEYYILIGENKFDKNCRICQVDNYSRCKLRPKGEIKDYIINEINERGNVDVTEIDANGLFITYLLE